jgi:hypothetical protein
MIHCNVHQNAGTAEQFQHTKMTNKGPLGRPKSRWRESERRYSKESQERVGTDTRGTHMEGYRRKEEAFSQNNYHGENFNTVHRHHHYHH